MNVLFDFKTVTYAVVVQPSCINPFYFISRPQQATVTVVTSDFFPEKTELRENIGLTHEQGMLPV